MIYLEYYNALIKKFDISNKINEKYPIVLENILQVNRIADLNNDFSSVFYKEKLLNASLISKMLMYYYRNIARTFDSFTLIKDLNEFSSQWKIWLWLGDFKRYNKIYLNLNIEERDQLTKIFDDQIKSIIPILYQINHYIYGYHKKMKYGDGQSLNDLYFPTLLKDQEFLKLFSQLRTVVPIEKRVTETSNLI